MQLRNHGNSHSHFYVRCLFASLLDEAMKRQPPPRPRPLPRSLSSVGVGVVGSMFCIAVSIASFGNLKFLSYVVDQRNNIGNVHNSFRPQNLPQHLNSSIINNNGHDRRMAQKNDKISNFPAIANNEDRPVETKPPQTSSSSSSSPPPLSSSPPFLSPKTKSQITTIIEPRLIIHAGPLKTATTFLQGKMRKKPMRKSLVEDNIVVVKQYDFRFTKKLFQGCLLTPQSSNSTQFIAGADDQQQNQHPSGISESCQNRIDKFFDGLREIAEKFMDQYNKTTTNPPTLILSVEEYSKVPQTAVAKKYFLDRFIAPHSTATTVEWKWDVHVFLAYRKIFDWYPSMYHQYRKGLMYKSGMGYYRGFLPDEIEVDGGEKTVIVGTDDVADLTRQLTFPEWVNKQINLIQLDEKEFGDDANDANGETDDHRQTELFPRDSLGLIRFYQKYFGRDNQLLGPNNGRIHIFDFHVPDIEQEYFCHPILNASRTCAMITNQLNGTNFSNGGEKKEPKKANVLRMNLDEDLLAVEAYRQGLFVPRGKNREWLVGSKSGIAPGNNSNQKRQMAGGVKRHKLSVFLHEIFNADPSRLVGPAAATNLTLLQTELTCLNQRQWDWMWNRTLIMDDYMLNRSMSRNATIDRESVLQSEMVNLLSSNRKGCSLNVKRLLRDLSWKTLLRSAAFCLSNTTNCLSSFEA